MQPACHGTVLHPHGKRRHANEYPATHWPPRPAAISPAVSRLRRTAYPGQCHVYSGHGHSQFFLLRRHSGPIAYIQGTKALQTLDTYGDPTNVRGQVAAGRICGMIGGILSVIVIICSDYRISRGHHP